MLRHDHVALKKDADSLTTNESLHYQLVLLFPFVGHGSHIDLDFVAQDHAEEMEGCPFNCTSWDADFCLEFVNELDKVILVVVDGLLLVTNLLMFVNIMPVTVFLGNNVEVVEDGHIILLVCLFRNDCMGVLEDHLSFINT